MAGARQSRPEHRWRGARIVALAGLALAGGAAVSASDLPRAGDDPSATEINRRVTDPVTTTWSLQLENAVNFLDFGSQGIHAQDKLKFQPTMPVWLSRDLKLITRPDFTLLDDTPYADAAGGVSRTTGVGDTTCDLVLSPRLGAWLFALGPTFVFPTANLRQTGQGKWQMGPAGVLGYKARTWLAGVIWQQWWSFAGAADRRGVSQLHAQYIASWFFGDGWSLGTAPTIKVDWRADGERVTFPFGPSLAKVVKLDGLAVKFELRAMYAPIHPTDGEEAIIQILVTPIVPSLVVGPVFGSQE